MYYFFSGELQTGGKDSVKPLHHFLYVVIMELVKGAMCCQLLKHFEPTNSILAYFWV